MVHWFCKRFPLPFPITAPLSSVGLRWPLFTFTACSVYLPLFLIISKFYLVIVLTYEIAIKHKYSGQVKVKNCFFPLVLFFFNCLSRVVYKGHQSGIYLFIHSIVYLVGPVCMLHKSNYTYCLFSVSMLSLSLFLVTWWRHS